MRFSLSRINFLNIIINVLLFSVITAIFVLKFAGDFYHKRVSDFEKSYIEKNKILIQDEVNKTASRVETLKNIEFENNKNNLKDKIDFIQKVLDNNKKSYTTKELISKYKSQLNYYKWDNETGYIYIFDTKGVVLYHGNDENLVSKTISQISVNNKELYDFLHETLKKDENFGSYKWIKPNNETNELFKKYVYIKKDKKLGIYIAAGIYKNEVDNRISKTFLKELKKDRFGENNYGYFWVLNFENKMLMHPISKELEGKDQTNLTSIDNKKILVDISTLAQKQDSGYTSYYWKRPDNNLVDQKISYYQVIKDWDMIVVSGFYLTEMQDLLKKEKEDLKELLANYATKVIIILIILTIISILVGKLISMKIKKIENERNENNNLLEQYKMILDTTSVVSKSDIFGKIHYVNDNFEKVSGYKKEDLLNHKYSILRHPDNNKEQFRELWQTIKKGTPWKGIIKNKRKNGESYYNKTTIVPIKDSTGKTIEYISSSIDVTELIENRSKLNDLFKNDTLTGVGNRVSLINKLDKGEKASLALINIDRFKEINDSFSHETGDKIIKAFANRLFEFFSEKEATIYRVQADIFAIYAQNPDIKKMLKNVEEFMNDTGRKNYKIEENNFILTYTAGIAAEKENLLTFADIALSEAKNKKTRIKEYDNSMKSIEEFRNNIIWVEKLHHAIKEDRIIAHFQPIYNYKTKKIEKYEALMRLVEDDKIIYPNEYLDIAKKTRLYPELTYKMVEKVINKFSNLDLEFSINLCVEDLMNEELMSFVFDFATQKKVHDRMVLEIVESEEIEDSEFITNLLKKFKDKGCKIAIDDFGSGYSNYDYLIKLQADYIKIDGSIIKHILEDKRTQNLVKSIVSFAKKSNIKVIAEFVSSEEIDKMLREMGVDYAQGFYYGKPEEKLQ